MNAGARLISLSAHPDLRLELSPFGAGLYQVYFRGKKMLFSGKGNQFFKKNPAFFGQTVAPFAGRILHGKMGNLSFPLNEGPNCLHSGSFTTAFKDFEYEVEEKEDRIEAVFRLEQDIFGVKAETVTTYALFASKPGFSIRIDLTSDKPLPHNPTNHAYWNLGAEKLGDIRIRFKAHKRVNYGAFKHPEGFTDCASEFDGDVLRIDPSLDYGYMLDEPWLEARCDNVLLKATSPAKAVLIFTGLPSEKPCFTLEFVDEPLNDESMLKDGTTSVYAEYELEEI